MRRLVCALFLLDAAAGVYAYQNPLAKPYFDLQFSDTPISVSEAASRVAQTQTDFKYRILNDNKGKYLCAVPNVTTTHDPRNQEEQLRIAQEKEEQMKAGQRGSELLRGMEGSCLYYMSGYWTYKFCYSDGITQFHAKTPAPGMPMWPPTEDPNAGSYTLGKRLRPESKSDQDDNTAENVHFKLNGESKSLAIHYGHGTYCPIIGAERATEVRFQCYSGASDRIIAVKEVTSCQYQITVQTPRLCHDVAFQESAKISSETISCMRISDEVPLPALDAATETDSSLPVDAADQDETLMQNDPPKDTPKEEDVDVNEKEELSHLSFDQVPMDLSEMIRQRPQGTEKPNRTGGQRLPNQNRHKQANPKTGKTPQKTSKPKEPEKGDRFDAALELANDIANQLEDGTLTVHGESIFSSQNADVEFLVELQDENGEAMGNVVMKVVDGQVTIELEDELADLQEEKEKAAVQVENKKAVENIPAHVQANFDRFVGRDEL